MTLRASGLLRIILEETTLFGSVFKWTLLASGVGILVGFSTTLFLWVLGWTTSQVGHFPGALWLLPVGFLLAHLLVRYLAPDAEGHGTEKVVEAVHQPSGPPPASGESLDDRHDPEDHGHHGKGHEES